MRKTIAEAPSVEMRSEGTALQAANPQAVQPAPARPVAHVWAAQVWSDFRSSASRQRRSWTRSLALLSFLAMVVAPTIAATYYTMFWASDRFVSEFRVAVRSIQPIKTGGMADLFGFAGVSQAGNDSNAVVQYLQSRQAIKDLGGAKTVQVVYDDPSIDWFSRLRAGPPIEELTRYWDRMVDSYYESSTGTIIVRVSAFRPSDAYRIAAQLLANAEALVNRLSERARYDSVAFAAQELSQAESRLTDVRAKLKVLQDQESILDPQKTAEMTLSLAAKLKEQIANKNAALSTQRAQLSADAPSVQATRDELAGLQRELAKVEAQVTALPLKANGGEKPLTSVLGAFQQLADDKVFAEKAYQSALTSLETARMDASKQQVYLATIVPPGLPEEAAFPKPAREIALTFGVALAIWLIGLLGVHSVREHM
jgi:capsular polysaccharide transport system permease protein